MTLIISFLMLSVIINLLFFAVAYVKQTDQLTDFTYGLSFIIITLILLFVGFPNLPQLVLALLILAWAIRLIAYLVIRIRKIKKDDRFDHFRHQFWGFFQFWFLQGVSVGIIMIPSILFLGRQQSAEWQIFNILGLIVATTGLIIESVADYQKFVFKQIPANKDKWIDTGLWRYSRHPNYFGEMTFWWGIFIYSLPGLVPPYDYLSIISPVFITYLLIFVSGIPILEKKYRQKYRGNKEFANYQKSTSLLILWPPKN